MGVLSFVTAIDREGKLVLESTSTCYREGLGKAVRQDTVRTLRPNQTKPAREASLELLRGPAPPTAILAMSVLALGALQAAELGLHPREPVGRRL